MLRDRPRQIAYRDAIEQNRSQFEGKVVLDVGAGTGILSVLCAQAGAKRVFAVEASNIAKIARKIVKENKFEGIIEVVHSKIEDFQLPADIKEVDIIISEWMGFYLLHEGMLDSVIWARDRFLKSGGLMFPANATINLAPCRVPSRFSDWDNVDGVKMSSLASAIRSQKSQKPEIISLKDEDLLHEGTVMSWFDLTEITLDDIEELLFKEVIVIDRPGRYQGVCIWFECEFPINDMGDSVVLSTSPKSVQTHWQQTVVVLPETAHDDVEPKDPIAFSLAIKRNADNRRRYNMEMTLIDRDEIEHAIPCDCILTKCILTKAHLASLQTDTEMKE